MVKGEREDRANCIGSAAPFIHSFRLFQVMDPISGLVEKLAQGLGEADMAGIDADSVKEKVAEALGTLGFQKKKKKHKAEDEL